jgi:5-methylcytosine-specific restriction endonuclease McrA
MAVKALKKKVLTKRDLVFIRDGRKCRICGKTKGLTIDHIMPRSKGGSNEIDNLQTLCSKCNRLKADTIPDSSKQK